MASPLLNSDQQLRPNFKHLNQLIILLWRLGLGPTLNLLPDVGGRVMVISQPGRQIGRGFRAPVHYAVVDDDVYCSTGFGDLPDWYLNLKNSPEVHVWLPDGWWAGIAEEVTDSRVRLPLLRQVLISGGVAGRAAGIDPDAMTNEELGAAAHSCRLIRIHRTRPCTGPGGPGDLAWLWQVATGILLLLAVRRTRKR